MTESRELGRNESVGWKMVANDNARYHYSLVTRRVVVRWNPAWESQVRRAGEEGRWWMVATTTRG